jgi:SNF2 family DNA or RNA helicase
MKMDSVIQICDYHLAQNRAAPLLVRRLSDDELAAAEANAGPNDFDHQVRPLHDELVPNPDPEAIPFDPEVDDPDKIVIYLAFPSQSPILREALEVHGIESALFTGLQTPGVREANLMEFRRSTRTEGPRVLIMSTVGVFGLNLACANIMIVLVSFISLVMSSSEFNRVLQSSLWSALEDTQLIARLHRKPQVKQVEIYRLFARGTADLLLNNLAVSKEELSRAFLNTQAQISELSIPHHCRPLKH